MICLIYFTLITATGIRKDAMNEIKNMQQEIGKQINPLIN